MALHNFMAKKTQTLAAMPRAAYACFLSGRSLQHRFFQGRTRAQKGLTFAAICSMAILIGLPSVGSRIEDATLTADMRARLVLASVQYSDPAIRNKVMTETPETAPLRVASLDYEQSMALRSTLVMVQVKDARAADTRPAERGTLRIAAPLAQSPRPKARPASIAPDTALHLSTSGSVVAPAVMDLGLAPSDSLRPKARPATILRRNVQYSRSWLRSIEPRELNAQEACLATAIYHEARGEEIMGQFAVAEVILNRVASRKYPNTICSVVYQGVREGRIGGCQFSFACDGRSEAMPNRNAARLARRIAQVMADGGHRGLTDGALYFHTTAVRPSWSQRFTQTTRIGAHLFYRG